LIDDDCGACEECGQSGGFNVCQPIKNGTDYLGNNCCGGGVLPPMLDCCSTQNSVIVVDPNFYTCCAKR